MWIRTKNDEVLECEKVGTDFVTIYNKDIYKVGTDFVTIYNKDIYGENEVKKYGNKIEEVCDLFFLEIKNGTEIKVLTELDYLTIKFYASNKMADRICGAIRIPLEEDREKDIFVCYFDFSERVFKPYEIKMSTEEQIKDITISGEVN